MTMGLSTDEVVRRWAEGQPAGTAAAQVPGGRRVTSEEHDGLTRLYSYRTLIAVRTRGGNYALTERKYSTTTSRLMGRVQRLLTSRGFAPNGDHSLWDTAVPGRWGGYGPAWHATGTERLTFTGWSARCRLIGARCETHGEYAGMEHYSMQPGANLD